MPDNVVNLTFNGDFPQGGSFSGDINVDYSTNVATGNISATAGGYTQDFNNVSYYTVNHFTNSAGADQYSLDAQTYPGSIGGAPYGIVFSWTGETPQTFDSVSYAYNDNYYPPIPVTTANAPVTSTVVSVCLASGCLIATVRGEVPVERLQVGDLVLTASGESRAVRWIGCRSADCRGPGATALWPVRIAKDAFGADRPNRDLVVSPGHAVCVTGEMEATVRACDLINGALVAQIEVEAVTYWHVELDRHDIIFANGLPVESYLDEGNRSFFSSAAGHARAPGEARAVRCRPLVVEGEFLEKARARLLLRSFELGWTQREEPMKELHVVCDRGVVLPRVQGDRALFDLPDGCGDIWLVSEATSPRHLGINVDGRKLGLDLADIRIVADERSVQIRMDDTRLGRGFHDVETLPDGSLRRWTDGRARLPASVLRDATGGVVLQATLRRGLPRWAPPSSAPA